MEREVIKSIRNFNRYYTAWLNVMNKRYLGTNFSWSESRVLFEIYICGGISATELCEHLGMDKSYVSRVLAKFEKNGFLERKPVLGGRRIKKLYLTDRGEKEAEKIDKSGDEQIVQKLKFIDNENCKKLCEAMMLIEKILRETDKVRKGKHNEC